MSFLDEELSWIAFLAQSWSTLSSRSGTPASPSLIRILPCMPTMSNCACNSSIIQMWCMPSCLSLLNSSSRNRASHSAPTSAQPAWNKSDALENSFQWNSSMTIPFRKSTNIISTNSNWTTVCRIEKVTIQTSSGGLMPRVLWQDMSRQFHAINPTPPVCWW